MQPTEEKKIETSAGMKTATETSNRIKSQLNTVPVDVMENKSPALDIPKTPIPPQPEVEGAEQMLASQVQQQERALQAAESAPSDTVKRIQGLFEVLNERGEIEQQMRDDRGVTEQQQFIQSATEGMRMDIADLRKFNLDTQNLLEEARQDAGGRDITKGVFGAKAREFNLQRNLEAANKAYRIEATQAAVSAAAGDVALAEQQIASAMDRLYAPVEQALEMEKIFLQREWQKADKADQRLYESKNKLVDYQLGVIDDAKSLVELAARAGATPQEIQSMTATQNPAEQRDKALQVLGRVESADRDLDRAIKLANLRKLQEPKTATRSTQVVKQDDKSMLIDSQTGEIIAEYGIGEAPDSLLQQAKDANFVNSLDTLKDHPGLNSAVGPLGIARFGFADAFGAKDEFIGSVEQVIDQLTLNTFEEAKEKGMTFGAMSQGEWDILAQSATKLGNWRERNKAGETVGYDVNEKAFLIEMDTLSNFAKMDALRRGSAPEDVGALVTEDGKYWAQNSDGSYSELVF